VFEPENPDDYDLLMLDQEFAMLRAKEHSAQIPGAERERIENAFKSDNERINTLVCTPTLEMGGEHWRTGCGANAQCATFASQLLAARRPGRTAVPHGTGHYLRQVS
jgi:hypothetical protein